MILTGRHPSPAERARTVLGHASPIAVHIGRAEIGTAFRHVVPFDVSAAEDVDVVGVDLDGSLVLMVSIDGALARRIGEHAAPCVVHAALVSPVPGADRILDRVTVTGHAWLESDVTDAFAVLAQHRRIELAGRSEASILLRVMISGLLLNGNPVEPATYAAARADPLATVSDEFVEHLVRDHPAAVLRLAHLFHPDVVRGVRAFAPIRVDRCGLTFRLDGEGWSTRARLDFLADVRHPRDLPAAVHELQNVALRVTDCPFSAGPRSPVVGEW
ncbi:DUF2470 domain-containing protein [Nakamurella sp. GG22]